MTPIRIFARLSVYLLRLLGVLIASALGFSFGSLKSSDSVALADTGCFYVYCWPHYDYICRNHQPTCFDCWNNSGTSCGGPC